MRVDQVGSLLRPEGLKQTVLKHSRGQVGDEALRSAQDLAVRDVVAKQEAHSLPVVTDGEFRRLDFKDSFGESVSGFHAKEAGVDQFQGAGAEKPLQRWDYGPPEKRDVLPGFRRTLVERLRLARNLPLEEYAFAQRLTARPIKVTLICPGRISENFSRTNARSIYVSVDEFLEDVVAIERQIVSGLVQAGCRYIQIDAPSYTAFVDPPSLEKMRERGEDPQASLERAIRADNAVIAGFRNVTFGLHVCRGNQRSMWHREGSYDAIAEQLFNTLHHHRLLLEYDSDRAGGFEPLRFVPKNKVAVLGLVSSKVPQLETAEQLKRRIEEAARCLPLDQLALSPQCGFASGIAGNLLGEDDQWRKFDVIQQVAAQVWG
jgi:5-methyltetrahydropteroyltriglutamate--homocysteine methyltransferase